MKEGPGLPSTAASTALLVVAGIAVSAGFKFALGAPNYGLGIVLAATTACYLYGIRAALITWFLTSVGVLLLLIPPMLSVHVDGRDEWIRLLTVLLTSAVTCAIVLRLRETERKVRVQNERLDSQNEELQAQNEELQVLTEELHTTEEELRDRNKILDVQNEELQAQNEELETISEELREAEADLSRALARESRIARSLQAAFLPSVPRSIGRFEVATSYEAGSHEAEIGGDFYDMVDLGDGRFSVSIGDASGKGLDAARQAIAAKYGLRFAQFIGRSPAQCLSILNDKLVKDRDFSGFVTLFHGVVDAQEMVLTYCTGGHEPPLVLRKGTGECVRLEPTGRFVGYIPGGKFEEETVKLEPGDRILMFTDGLTEARKGQELLGSEGLQRMLSEVSSSSADAALMEIVDRAREYAGGKFIDDAAAILISVGEE